MHAYMCFTGWENRPGGEVECENNSKQRPLSVIRLFDLLSVNCEKTGDKSTLRQIGEIIWIEGAARAQGRGKVEEDGGGERCGNGGVQGIPVD